MWEARLLTLPALGLIMQGFTHSRATWHLMLRSKKCHDQGAHPLGTIFPTRTPLPTPPGHRTPVARPLEVGCQPSSVDREAMVARGGSGGGIEWLDPA